MMRFSEKEIFCLLRLRHWKRHLFSLPLDIAVCGCEVRNYSTVAISAAMTEAAWMEPTNR